MAAASSNVEMKDAEDVRLAKTEAKLLINDEFDKTLVGVKGTICFHLIDSSVFGQFSVSLHHHTRQQPGELSWPRAPRFAGRSAAR